MEDKETNHGSRYCKKGGNAEAWLITKESVEQVDLPALTLNFLDLYVEVHRMPPTLRPFRYRSFGHFILTSRWGRPWNMSLSKHYNQAVKVHVKMLNKWQKQILCSYYKFSATTSSPSIVFNFLYNSLWISALAYQMTLLAFLLADLHLSQLASFLKFSKFL